MRGNKIRLWRCRGAGRGRGTRAPGDGRQRLTPYVIDINNTLVTIKSTLSWTKISHKQLSCTNNAMILVYVPLYCIIYFYMSDIMILLHLTIYLKILSREREFT